MINFILSVYAGFTIWMLLTYPVVGCLLIGVMGLTLLMRRYPPFATFVLFFLLGLRG